MGRVVLLRARTQGIQAGVAFVVVWTVATTSLSVEQPPRDLL